MLGLLLLSPAAVVAADEGAAFLTLGAGARPAAMGGAWTAVADDVNSAFWNPAGLARLERNEFQFSHREAVAGIRYETVGVARRMARGAFAATASYLGQPSLSGRDELGAPTGAFNAYDLSAGVHYARNLPFLPGTGFGAGIRYIRSRIAEASAQTVAADLGAQWQAARSFGPGTPSLGLAVRNLGPGLRFLDQSSSLPLTMSVGLGYRLPQGLLADADFISRPNADLNGFAAGLEYALYRSFFMRAGYSSIAAQTSGGGVSGALSGFTAGFGVKLTDWTMDYAMTPMGELGPAQNFSLGARF